MSIIAWLIIWLVQAGFIWFGWNVLIVWVSSGAGGDLVAITWDYALFIAFMITVVEFLISMFKGRD